MPKREPFEEFVQRVAKAVWENAPLDPALIRIGAPKPLPALEPDEPAPAPLMPASDGDVVAYTVDETAAKLKISRAHLYAEWRKGRGPAFVPIGGTRRVTPRALDAYLAGKTARMTG